MRAGWNRLTPIVISATVWLWAGALVGLWGRLFGTTSTDLWLSAGATAAAFAVALAAPARFFDLVQAVLKRLWPRRLLSIPPVEPASAPISRQVTRLLAVALLSAAAGGLLSAMGVRLAARAVERITAGFLLSPPAYRWMQAGVQGLVMLGWGLGAALVHRAMVLTAADVEGSSAGERGLADGLAALAVAMAVVAAVWRMGGDLLLVALAAGAAQVGLALALFARRDGGDGGGAVRSPRSRTSPSLRLRLGVVGRGALAAWIAAVQVRGLADWAETDPPARIGFLAFTVALAALFARGWAQRRFVRVGKVTAGAVVLAGAALGVQLAIGLEVAAGAPHGLLAVAAAGQVFLAAAAVLIMLASRRRFLDAGGSPRRWLQGALAGAAAGAAAGAWGVGVPDGRAPTLAALLALLAAALVAGIAASRRTGRQWTWATAGGLLLLAMTAALTASSRDLRRRRPGPIAPGRWLTAYQRGEACGYLPESGSPFICRLDVEVTSVLSTLADVETTAADGARPNWWRAQARYLAVSRRPLLTGAEPSLIVHRAAADPALGRLPLWRSTTVEDMWPGVRFGRFENHGVVYAPLRVDHPAAEALFGPTMLAAALERTARGGVFVLHAPCAGPDVSALPAVAGRLHALAGEVVVVARVDSPGAEMLVIHLKSGRPGWAARVRQALATRLAGRAEVIDGRALAPLWEELSGRRDPAGGLTAGELAAFLDRAAAAKGE